MLSREVLHIEPHRKWMTVQSGWQPTQLVSTQLRLMDILHQLLQWIYHDISKYPINFEVFWIFLNYITFLSPLAFLSQAFSFDFCSSVLTFSTFSSSTWANLGGGSQNFRCSKPSICTAGVCSKQCLDPWHFPDHACPSYEGNWTMIWWYDDGKTCNLRLKEMNY